MLDCVERKDAIPRNSSFVAKVFPLLYDDRKVLQKCFERRTRFWSYFFVLLFSSHTFYPDSAIKWPGRIGVSPIPENILKGYYLSRVCFSVCMCVFTVCVNAKSKSTWFSNLPILFVSSVDFWINETYSWSRKFPRMFFIGDLFLDTSILP